jgi:hypothetical protein
MTSSVVIGRAVKTGFALAAASAMVLLSANPASAATTYTSSGLGASVSGTTVKATVTLKASATTYASLSGICARNSSGHNMDFPLEAHTIGTRGTTVTATRNLAAGSYTYWGCAKVNGSWMNIGSTKTFTVAATPPPPPPPTSTSTPTQTPTTTASPTTATPTPSTTSPASITTAPTTSSPSMVPPTITTAPTTPAVGPSGERMPVGDLPGWKQVFTDDFTTDVARGGFPGPYASKWTQYHGFYDTFKTGYYDKGAISTAGGAMDLFLRTENGKAIAAAPVPIVTKAWEGQTYGRFTVRFRSDSMPGYKTAWLLWPDTNNWNEGEIDFPEGGLDSTMMGFNHCVGDPSKNCSWWDTKKKFSDGWHTATIEWAPNKLTFILDGISSTTTTSVPATPMHWVLQTETNGKLPPTTTAGHLQIDWVSVYTYAP